MKKNLFLLFAAIFVLSAVLTTCENPLTHDGYDTLVKEREEREKDKGGGGGTLTHTPTHTHTWGLWTVTTPATAANPVGQETRTCATDPSHTETRAGGSFHYAPGDTGPGGGIIFYVADGQGDRPLGFTMTDDNSTCYYLEAAPAGWNTSTAPNDPSLAWTPATSPAYGDIAGTGGTAIGTGRENTALILAVAGAPAATNAPAADACNTYGSPGGWFLPSKGEVSALWTYNGTPSLGLNTTSGTWYWSSSQYDTTTAYYYQVGGTQLNTAKTNSNGLVRPIRAF